MSPSKLLIALITLPAATSYNADAADETQESATWRCGDDGCHQVVDDDEHKDGDEVIEEDYYDDDYEQEGASD
jgi:hypothetical protein